MDFGTVAVAMGRWYAHRASGEQVELYDLISDPDQSIDLSSNYTDIVKKEEEIMKIWFLPLELMWCQSSSPASIRRNG